jgi:hypothetical protein
MKGLNNYDKENMLERQEYVFRNNENSVLTIYPKMLDRLDCVGFLNLIHCLICLQSYLTFEVNFGFYFDSMFSVQD